MSEQKKKLEKLSGVKGMNDILPQDAALWEFFESTVKSMLRANGTPIIEQRDCSRAALARRRKNALYICE
jgi:histidyl-tRNA synthetase